HRAPAPANPADFPLDRNESVFHIEGGTSGHMLDQRIIKFGDVLGVNMAPPDFQAVFALSEDIIQVFVAKQFPAAVGKMKSAPVRVPLPYTVTGCLDDTNLARLALA